MRIACLALASTLAGACASTAPRVHADARPTRRDGRSAAIKHPDGETPAWWFRDGAAQAAQRGAMAGKAKNVILFVGDGMSLTTVAAARILDGQRKGAPGRGEPAGAGSTFPPTALSKTYNTDSQTPDSAGTMSAMATGVKTRAGVLSIGQAAAARRLRRRTLTTPLLTLWELAASQRLGTGVVTTTRVTHATPGATFSHSAHRNWENDADLSDAGQGRPAASTSPGR